MVTEVLPPFELDFVAAARGRREADHQRQRHDEQAFHLRLLPGRVRPSDFRVSTCLNTWPSSRRRRSCAPAPAPSWSRPSSAAPTIGGELVTCTLAAGATRARPALTAPISRCVARLHQAAAEGDGDRLLRQLEPFQRDADHGHDLFGEPVDDRRGRRRRARPRRRRPARARPPGAARSGRVDRLGELHRRLEPEVRRDRAARGVVFSPRPSSLRAAAETSLRGRRRSLRPSRRSSSRAPGSGPGARRGRRRRS